MKRPTPPRPGIAVVLAPSAPDYLSAFRRQTGTVLDVERHREYDDVWVSFPSRWCPAKVLVEHLRPATDGRAAQP